MASDPDTGTSLDDDGADAEAQAFGRWLFAQECRFVAGAASERGLPEIALDEVAFAGRSNVGKSTLINALTGRKSLARVSHTPGRTQQINFFDLGGRLMLADLPGYGYAKASKRAIAGWNRLIGRYLRGRPSLRRVCLLVDARHGLKANDDDVLTQLDEAAVSTQIVLTKVDKLSAAALADRREEVASRAGAHPACHPVIVDTSARTGAGIDVLRAALGALVSV